MVGTGLPEALHSKVTSVPFFTTILPSAGLGLTRGGTETETQHVLTVRQMYNFCQKIQFAKKGFEIGIMNFVEQIDYF